LLTLAAFAGWQKTTTNSDGTNYVTIVAAPGASTNRTITANGGIKVHNDWTNTVSFHLADVTATTTNEIEFVELATNETYISDWVHILDGTTNTLQLYCVEACTNGLNIFTHYRDEVQ